MRTCNAGCHLDLTLAGKKDLLDGCILQCPSQYLQVILIRMGKPALPPPNTKGLRIFIRNLIWVVFLLNVFFCALNYSEEEHFRSA